MTWWFNPLGWWPPSPDWAPGLMPTSGFQALATAVVASDYAASRSLYDALFEAVGLSGTGETARNYAGVLALSQAQESGPTTNAAIILFVDSADTVERTFEAGRTAGGTPYDGGEGAAPPDDYHWKSLRDVDLNAIYIVAKPTN